MALKSNADSSSNAGDGDAEQSSNEGAGNGDSSKNEDAADGDGDGSSSEGGADGLPAAQQAPAQQGDDPLAPAPAQQLFPALPMKRKLHDRRLSDTPLAKKAKLADALPADIVQGAPTVPCACCVPLTRHTFQSSTFLPDA